MNSGKRKRNHRIVFWRDADDGIIHAGIVNEVIDKTFLSVWLSDICPDVHIRRSQLLEFEPLYKEG